MTLGTPAFKWEFNLNTIAILAGFAAGLVAWGYTISGWTESAIRIEKVVVRVDKLEQDAKVVSQIEYRITVNETADKARDDRMDRFADVVQSLRGSLGEIITKIEVVSSKFDAMAETLKEQRRDRELGAGAPPR